MPEAKIRNVAIIAHVDHGKTTLLDGLLKEAKVFASHEEVAERVMDSGDLERERGITIQSKNTSLEWKGSRINIVDTPGHADFGGEVERVMGLVEGVLLVVDAVEGPMPQTRFVLSKALAAGCRPLVVVNKVDRPERQPDQVVDQVFDLLVSLGASDEQLDFAPLFCSAKEGWASADWHQPGEGMAVILDHIIKNIPVPESDISQSFKMQVISVQHNDYVGRIALGKGSIGSVKQGEVLWWLRPDGTKKQGRCQAVYRRDGMTEVKVEASQPGDIVMVAGFPEIDIGDTLVQDENGAAFDALSVEDPTLAMVFRVNDSPLSGREGQCLTGTRLGERLEQEARHNIALKVEKHDKGWLVKGRGLLHLSILIETMRREGDEFAVGPPEVIKKKIDGESCEPYELLTIDCPEAMQGRVMEVLGTRRATLQECRPYGDRVNLEFVLPVRATMGLRTRLLNATQGEAVIAMTFDHYGPMAGELEKHRGGALVSMDQGAVTNYALDGLQDRGVFYTEAAEEVYEGMIVGESNKDKDMTVNPVKGKKHTNMRAAGSDRSLKVAPKIRLSLEEYLEFLAPDELLEVTPGSLRLRKVLLKEIERKRAAR